MEDAVPGPRDAMLEESLRQVERVLDRQADGIARQVDAMARLLNTSIAALVGLLAISGLLGQVDALGPGSWLPLLGAGALSLLGAAALLAAASSGFVAGPESSIGVDVATLALWAEEPAWTREALMLSAVAAAADAARYNGHVTGRLARTRRAALVMMLAGVAAVAAGLLLIVGRWIPWM